MFVGSFFSSRNSSATKSIVDLASGYFAAVANLFSGPSNHNLVLPFNPSQEEDSSASDISWNALDTFKSPATEIASTTSLQAIEGGQASLDSIQTDRVVGVFKMPLFDVLSNDEGELEELFLIEPLEAENDNDSSKSVPVQKEGACLHDTQKDCVEEVKPRDGQFNSRNRNTSAVSASTSGVYSSQNVSLEGSAIDFGSSSTKLSSSFEKNDAAAESIWNRGSFKRTPESVIHELGDTANNHSVPAQVIYDPSYVPENEEYIEEVTVRHTILSPRTNEETDAFSNDEPNPGNFNDAHCYDSIQDNQPFNCKERSYSTDVTSENDRNSQSECASDDEEITMTSDNFICFDQSLLTEGWEEELQNAEIHEYFELQRRSLHGQYRIGPIGRPVDQEEIEKEIDAKIENPGLRSIDSREHYHDPFTNSIDFEHLCPIEEDDDEEFLAEEQEYFEERTMSRYEKYTRGLSSFHPVSMDDVLEERLNLKASHVRWVFPDAANDYHGDSYTAIVPFANEIKEEDQEIHQKKSKYEAICLLIFYLLLCNLTIAALRVSLHFQVASRVNRTLMPFLQIDLLQIVQADKCRCERVLLLTSKATNSHATN